MDNLAFAASPCGRLIRTRTGYDAFVPDYLPPALSWDSAVTASLESAATRLGHLHGYCCAAGDAVGSLLLAKDAVTAICADGRPITSSGYFRALATGESNPAVRLVAGYVAAFEHGCQRIAEFPLSLRLLRELHFALSHDVMDPRLTPGQFRTSQNWLGSPGCTLSNATFVPPPATEMWPLLDNWERFLHKSDDLPGLIRLSLVHLQYLIIHPFLEMNILTGSLLAGLMLPHLGLTSTPMPVLGQWLGRSAPTLQSRMLDVCARGCWEEWLCWYLHGLADAATATLDCAGQLLAAAHARDDRANREAWGDDTKAMARIQLQQPVMTVAAAARRSELTETEAAATLEHLASLGLATCETISDAATYAAEDILAALEPGSPDAYHRLAF